MSDILVMSIPRHFSRTFYKKIKSANKHAFRILNLNLSLFFSKFGLLEHSLTSARALPPRLPLLRTHAQMSRETRYTQRTHTNMRGKSVKYQSCHTKHYLYSIAQINKNHTIRIALMPVMRFLSS